MSIRRKGNRWEVRLRVGGDRRIERRLPAGATRADALALEGKIRRELVAVSLGRYDHPISAAIDRWQIDAQRLRSWQRDLRYRTDAVRNTYGTRRLSELQDVADAIKSAGARAKKSPAAVNRYLAVLRRIGRLAARWEWIDRAPVIEMVPGERSRTVVLTVAQVRRLLVAADPRLAPMILFAALTGMRKAEQLALTPDSIVDGHAILPDTKAGRPRAVPLPPDAMKIAHECLPWALQRENVRKLFDQARKRAGINARWHDLRRTYGSWLMTGGAKLHEVRDLLGHGDVRTTSIYLATARQDLRDAVKVLPNLLGDDRGNGTER